MATMVKKQFTHSCTVRELIMALRSVNDHNAIVFVQGEGHHILRVELTELSTMNLVYLMIGDQPPVDGPT